MCAGVPTGSMQDIYSGRYLLTTTKTYSAALAQARMGAMNMLETIAILLILLWALGLVSSVTLGGFVHVLLVLAIVVILMRVIQGRKLL